VADQDLPLLDKTLEQTPKDIRDALAERGRNDLYFFGKAILGYRQMVPHCHQPLCMFFDLNQALIKLCLHPRGTFKTSSVTIARNAQKAVKNVNERICIINEVADNAEGFLSTIRQHFEGNRVLRTLYSELIPKDYRKVPWNTKALRLNREWVGPEETIEATGILSALTSHHYTHLAYDDLISENAVKSPQVMTDTIERARKFRSLMVDPAHSTLDMIGTRWALHDVYSHFMKMLGKQMGLYVRGAIKPNGDLLFPELLDAETLARLRDEYGEYMFSCLYMNNPRDVANQDFNVNDLRFWRWSTDGQSVILYDPNGSILREWELSKLDVTVSVDLAISEKITSDRNAVVTVGCSPLGEAIVLDTFVKRCTPLDVISHLFEVKHRFNPRVIGIESVAYQKALKYFLQAECERRREYMNVIDLKAIPSKRGQGNNSKEMRIRGLQPVAATGRLYILPTMHILRNELADFPLGEHDDSIDALAHQLTMWRGLLSPERIAKYKESERRLIQRIHSEEPSELPIEMRRQMAGVTSRHPRDQITQEDLMLDPADTRFSPWNELPV
jgi:hypothetical protein